MDGLFIVFDVIYEEVMVVCLFHLEEAEGKRKPKNLHK